MWYNNTKYFKVQSLTDTYICETFWIQQKENISKEKLKNEKFKKIIFQNLLNQYPNFFIKKCTHDNLFYPYLDFSPNKNITIKNKSSKGRQEAKGHIEKNTPILRMLKNGNTSSTLTCLSKDVELVSPYNSVDFNHKPIFYLHHVCFENGKSEGKLKKEPSKYISSYDLTNTDKLYSSKLEGINQLLLCQLMDDNCHSSIHQNYSSDNLQRYLDYPDIYDTSYHFLSESNYNNCLDYIESFGYVRDHLLSYEEMLKINLKHAPVKK